MIGDMLFLVLKLVLIGIDLLVSIASSSTALQRQLLLIFNPSSES